MAAARGRASGWVTIGPPPSQGSSRFWAGIGVSVLLGVGVASVWGFLVGGAGLARQGRRQGACKLGRRAGRRRLAGPRAGWRTRHWWRVAAWKLGDPCVGLALSRGPCQGAAASKPHVCFTLNCAVPTFKASGSFRLRCVELRLWSPAETESLTRPIWSGMCHLA